MDTFLDWVLAHKSALPRTFDQAAFDSEELFVLRTGAGLIESCVASSAQRDLVFEIVSVDTQQLDVFQFLRLRRRRIQRIDMRQLVVAISASVFLVKQRCSAQRATTLNLRCECDLLCGRVRASFESH